MRVVYRQDWQEYERGTYPKPDGFTLHLSTELRDKYIRNYWDSMPDEVQESYDAPHGKPYPFEVNERVYRMLEGITGKHFYQEIFDGIR